MSLSKQIIYGSDEEVANSVRFGVKLDEVDEYGYTPLVQTAIVNSATKARILLEGGADPNFTDLTGRTALHWAADNNNPALCQLLLEHKADPNVYTLAGQPVLAMPLLRDYTPIKKVLYKHGAVLAFAQDFVNSKLLGHRFNLEGRVDIVDSKGAFLEMEFEGFYLEFSIAIVVESLMDFKNNFGGKHLQKHFDKLQVIIDCLRGTSILLKYQHYLINEEDNASIINGILKSAPLVIPLSFEGHAVCFIKFGDWLLRCDRGEFGRDNGTVIIYRMNNPHRCTVAFIKSLIYKKQDKQFINESLIQVLGLESLTYLPLMPQISGNCAWSNVEAVVPAMMFLLTLEKMRGQQVVDMEACKKIAMNFYEEWINWDRERALHFCLESFNDASDARKASKAATLAAVLFQYYEYDHIEEHRSADRILKILTKKKFDYILRAYIKVFSREKDNSQYENLIQFMDNFGVDVESYR